ncbi:MAG: hypothetical protein L7F78_03455 [Syntrophales bacterium LBB04]|nr:hypothetical protein [Syntrophales bacterium LBB04]
MNTKCRDCGKETEADEIYCPQCADSLGAVKRKKIWLFAGIFSALLLILTGMLLWSGTCCNLDLSWGDLTGNQLPN